jgi:hypothetical protein
VFNGSDAAVEFAIAARGKLDWVRIFCSAPASAAALNCPPQSVCVFEEISN